MKYIITGSTGHISKPLAQKLIASGNEVTIISHDPARRKEIESMKASAAIGSVEDVNFLISAFKGADAVYTMIPPTFTPSDWKKHIASMGKNYAEAIRKNSIKYVVNLSSVGAHLPEGCGPVSGLHFAEKELNELEGVNVLHLRPGYFYSNFFNSVGMIKQMGIIGGNFGNETKIVLAHTNDIAEIAAEELKNLKFKGKSHRYISSDEKTTEDIARELGGAIGKPDLKWVDFTDEQNMAGLLQAGLPPEFASNYTEMGAAMRTGKMFEEYEDEKKGVVGKINLHDFSNEFAKVFNA